MANPRKTAVRALIRVLCEDGYSNLVLDSELSRGDLSPGDRGLVAAIFLGVLERKITLDYYLEPHVKGGLSRLSPFVLNVLRAGAYQILYLDKIPDSAAVNESVSLVKYSKERSAAGLVNAVLRSLIREGKRELPAGDSPEALSIRYSCSQEIVKGLIADYGPEFTKDYLAASFGPAPLTLRVNTLKTTPERLLSDFESAGIDAHIHELLPEALEVDFRGNIPDLPGFAQGLFHVQGAASQLACAALGPKPGERVLDTCAAPGGKTATMAQLMQDRGELIACDLHPARVGLIEKTMQRLGVACVKYLEQNAEFYSPELGLFDKILCDVPCSGLGILRKKPEIHYKLVTNLDKLPEIQYRILCTSVRYLKPGGLLVYSTCTVRRAENEDVISRFLAETEGYEPAPVGILGTNSHTCTLSPHIHKTDGFFIAALRKK